MKKIRKVDAVSVGKVSAVIYGFFGLFAGAGITLASVVGSARSSNVAFGMAFGAASIVIVPVIYAFIGFIGGIIGGWIYNLGAKWTGGIQVEIE